jgi:hypothetical protein
LIDSGTIQFDVSDEGGPYLLEVSSVPAGDSDPDVVKNLTVVRQKKLDRGLSITYPHASDNSICQDFAAYGDCSDLANNITGTMTPKFGGQAPKPSQTGVTLQGKPHWVIQFTGVPEGKPYTLDVTSTDGGDSSDGLDVAPCPPP